MRYSTPGHTIRCASRQTGPHGASDEDESGQGLPVLWSSSAADGERARSLNEHHTYAREANLTTAEGPAEAASTYRWVVFGIWSVCSVAGFMVISTIGILLPAISADLDLSPGQQGTLSSAAFWGNIALTIPLSLWASRFRPKPLTTVTLILGTLFLLLQGWAFTFAVLLLGRLAFGVSIIAREPARPLLIQQWFLPREAIIANAIASALFGLVVGGGLIVTPFVLSAVGDDWNLVLHIFGAFFAGLTVLWMVLGKDKGNAGAGQIAGDWGSRATASGLASPRPLGRQLGLRGGDPRLVCLP